ncbi:hypothetical protein ACVW1A_000383 [Bradyrhizobium sp. LB1.3]
MDPIVRLTSARSVEVQKLWDVVKRSPAEALFGQGFGAKFTVNYISPNDYEVVKFDRAQADLEPVQIALTSGLPLAILFTSILCGIVAMAFVRITMVRGVDFTIALFSIGSLLDTLLGFPCHQSTMLDGAWHRVTQTDPGVFACNAYPFKETATTRAKCIKLHFVQRL